MHITINKIAYDRNVNTQKITLTNTWGFEALRLEGNT